MIPTELHFILLKAIWSQRWPTALILYIYWICYLVIYSVGYSFAILNLLNLKFCFDCFVYFLLRFIPAIWLKVYRSPTILQCKVLKAHNNRDKCQTMIILSSETGRMPWSICESTHVFHSLLNFSWSTSVQKWFLLPLR